MINNEVTSMQTVILAGGFGTRFFGITKSTPKPMIEVNGQPLIVHVMKVYVSQGYKEFIICTGYLSEVIREYFKKYCVKDIGEYSILNLPEIGEVKAAIIDTGLDSTTAKRLELVRKYLNETFFLTYADGISDIDLNELLKVHQAGGYTVTLTTVPIKDQFGSLILNENKVVSFQEKKQKHWINAGFMVCNQSIFRYLKSSEMLEVGTLPEIAEAGELGAYKHIGFWKCVDNIQDKLELEKHLEEKGKQ